MSEHNATCLFFRDGTCIKIHYDTLTAAKAELLELTVKNIARGEPPTCEYAEIIDWVTENICFSWSLQDDLWYYDGYDLRHYTTGKKIYLLNLERITEK